MPAAIRRIHSKYLRKKAFPQEITEFEIREFFALNAADVRAARYPSLWLFARYILRSLADEGNRGAGGAVQDHY
jgi:hypothetical protein